jgi:type III pantothenate kinase
VKALLLADIGNTTVKFWLWGGEGWVGELSVVAAAAGPAALCQAAQQAGLDFVVAVVSAPAQGQAVEEKLQTAGLRLLRAGRDFQIPLPTNYYDPREIGPDRLCNALAARETFGAPVVTCSAGTCLTVEAVNEAGVLVGGAIAAGLAGAARGVAQAAPHLADKIELGGALLPSELVPGRSTAASLRCGLHLQAAATVDAFVRLGRAAVGEQAPAVLTGGDAQRLRPLCQLVDHVVPSLTLDGLRRAFLAA